MRREGPKSAASAWERATVPDSAQMAARDRARLRNGVILGALLGLAYGGISQTINRLFLPGINLYQPPAGPIGNTLLSIGLGLLLGALACFPPSAALGILMGSIASLLGIFVYMIAKLGGVGLGPALVASVLFSVPMAWLTVPVIALLRWAAERQVEAASAFEPLLHRARIPIVLMLVMAVLGGFELLPADARSTLQHMDALIQQGLAAETTAALPAALQRQYVTNFPPAQRTNYTLEWTRFDLNRFIELRPPSNFDEHAAVIARFGPSYYLVCVYPTATREPTCANYAALPDKAPERRGD